MGGLQSAPEQALERFAIVEHVEAGHESCRRGWRHDWPSVSGLSLEADASAAAPATVAAASRAACAGSKTHRLAAGRECVDEAEQEGRPGAGECGDRLEQGLVIDPFGGGRARPSAARRVAVLRHRRCRCGGRSRPAEAGPAVGHGADDVGDVREARRNVCCSTPARIDNQDRRGIEYPRQFRRQPRPASAA